MDNQLHRRVRENEEHDFEKGYGENQMNRENSYPKNHKKNQINTNIFIFMFLFLVSLMMMGMYIDFRKIDTSKHVSSRRLNHEFRECIRVNYEDLKDYLKCITDSKQIMIISDKSEETILTDYLYREYEMGYKHLRDIFENVDDLFTFMDMFQNRSPWIFLDGTYIGNEKDLSEYYIYNLIKDNPQVSPSLNEVERKYVKSNTYDKLENTEGMDDLFIRKHLRKQILKETMPTQQIMQHIIDELELVQDLMNKNHTENS